jgi:hypothetical protein
MSKEWIVTEEDGKIIAMEPYTEAKKDGEVPIKEKASKIKYDISVNSGMDTCGNGCKYLNKKEGFCKLFNIELKSKGEYWKRTRNCLSGD